MFKDSRLFLLAILLVLTVPGHTATLLLDFEEQSSDPADGPFAQHGPDFGVSQGFHFYRSDGVTAGGWVDPKVNPTPSANTSDVALDWCAYCGGDGTVTMESTIGAFDLQQLDFSMGAVVSTDDPAMDITGYLAGGGTVFMSLVVPTYFVWDTLVFDGSWAGLERIEFDVTSEGTVAYLDNIVVSNVVPIPAAVWLFGSGLGLLGWIRRRKTA